MKHVTVTEGPAASAGAPRSEPTTSDDAADFTEMLGSLWQLVTLASRSHGDLPVLPPSQARALQLVIATPDATPTQLAAEMDLSRPMVSELVRKLEQGGLITRRRSVEDGRSVILTATEHGRYVVRSFREGVNSAVAEAFGGLARRDVQRIMGSMKALGELRTRLVEIARREEDVASHRGEDAATA